MRINNKSIQTIVSKNFETTDIIKNKSGVFVYFEHPEDMVCIKLVDGMSCMNNVGIHLHNFQTKEELEHSLVDAIQTALKDNFATIWIHNKPRPNPERREQRLESLKKWVESNRKAVPSNYHLNKLFVSPEAVLDSMSEDQIDVVLALVAGTFARGCEETRQYWVPKYNNFKAVVREKLGQDEVNKIHSLNNQWES